MGDFSNPEIDLGMGKVSEVSAEQVEQFHEQMAQAQAALQKLQKDEGKARKKDSALATLLSAFVKDQKDDDLLRLIIYCLNLGIPINFIVAILSIAYAEVYEAINEQFKKETAVEISKADQKFLNKVNGEEDKDLISKQEFDEHKLPEDVKKRVNEWVRDILLLSLENKQKTLETVYEEGFKPHISPLQLASKILERYLGSVNIEGSFERIQAFAEFILRGIGKELQKEHKQIAEK